MPFVLLVAGTILLIAAARNTQNQLFFLLENDFTGPNNFIYWFTAILIIGAVGYIPKLKPLSDSFLVLLIVVLFLKKGTGFFDQFNAAIATTNTASPTTNPNPELRNAFTGTGGGSVINVGLGGSGGVNIGRGGIGISLPGIGVSF